MPKFYVELLGTVEVRWGIQVTAATVDDAEQEVLRSAPEREPMSWKLGAEVLNIHVDEVDTLEDEPRDKDLGRLELEDKYSEKDGGTWGHHPVYHRYQWKQDVEEDNTVCGYWDWVYNKVQNEDEPE